MGYEIMTIGDIEILKHKLYHCKYLIFQTM